eukprot:sb/3473284/
MDRDRISRISNSLMLKSIAQNLQHLRKEEPQLLLRPSPQLSSQQRRPSLLTEHHQQLIEQQERLDYAQRLPLQAMHYSGAPPPPAYTPGPPPPQEIPERVAEELFSMGFRQRVDTGYHHQLYLSFSLYLSLSLPSLSISLFLPLSFFHDSIIF